MSTKYGIESNYEILIKQLKEKTKELKEKNKEEQIEIQNVIKELMKLIQEYRIKLVNFIDLNDVNMQKKEIKVS